MNLQPAKITITEADGGRICIGSEDPEAEQRNHPDSVSLYRENSTAAAGRSAGPRHVGSRAGRAGASPVRAREKYICGGGVMLGTACFRPAVDG